MTPKLCAAVAAWRTVKAVGPGEKQEGIVPNSLAKNTVKVLIVEDNSIFRQVLRESLRACCDTLAVSEAASLAEARKVLWECTPDLVLLDLNLPDGNGLDLAAQIQRELPSVRVVVCTSHGISEYREAARRLGVAHFLCKQDLDWDEVHGLVDGVTGKRPEGAPAIVQ